VRQLHNVVSVSQPAFPGHLIPEDPDLDERQRLLFRRLVEMHMATARPISSEVLAHEPDIPTSSASVRSSLGELEELGLLEKPHVSGGRIPTPRGYELYVRALLAPAGPDQRMIDEVDRALGRSARDVRELLDEASRVLSSLTHQLALAMATSLGGETLSNLELAPLGERRALLVLGLGEAAVRTLVLELDSALDPGELSEVESVLRERLLACSLREVRDRLSEDPELVRSSAVRIVAAAVTRSWERPIDTPLFRAGAMHIAEQPEFQGRAALAPILRSVELGSPLDRLLVHGVEGQACARVGIDEDRALSACSLVAFPLPGRVRAAVGILGPLRLDYARAFAAVEAVGSRLAEILDS